MLPHAILQDGSSRDQSPVSVALLARALAPLLIPLANAPFWFVGVKSGCLLAHATNEYLKKHHHVMARRVVFASHPYLPWDLPADYPRDTAEHKAVHEYCATVAAVGPGTRHEYSLLNPAAGSPRDAIATLSAQIGREISDITREAQEWVHKLERSNTMEYPHTKTLHDLFVEQAARTPDAVAVSNGAYKAAERVQVTYRELDEMSDALAVRLQHDYGVTTDAVVGILMDRSVEYVIAILATLKAGGAFMPLELVYPKNLLAKVLEETKARCVLTKSAYHDRLPSETRVECIDSPAASVLEPGPEPRKPARPADLTPDSLAFVVMSSGTTGVPKAILQTHRAAVHSYHWRFVHYPYHAGELDAAGVFFIWEVIRPLLVGHPLCCIPDSIVFDPEALVDYLCANKVTRVLLTPSLCELVLDFASRHASTSSTPNSVREKLATLEIVWLCGEVVTMDLRDKFLGFLPKCKLLNLYSISEAHDVSVADLGELTARDFPEFAPCGVPFENVNVLILDGETLDPLPLGVTGEVFVASVCLARGYLNQPEKTAERFLPVPKGLLRGQEDGTPPPSTMYRTGDRGRILPNSGSLELAGRCDFMVKVRGYSIVLGAVEAAIASHPKIATSVVLVDGNEGEEKRLVAYTVPADWKSVPSAATLRKFLKDHIPPYAIPSIFVQIDALPIHGASQKLNRKALPDLKVAKRLRAHSVDSPRYTAGSGSGSGSGSGMSRTASFTATPTEIAVASVWSDILRLPDAHPDLQESFFEVGGHSLLATRFVAAVNDALGVKVDLAAFMAEPNIAAVAALVDSLRAGPGDGDGDGDAAGLGRSVTGALGSSSSSSSNGGSNAVDLFIEATQVDHSIYAAPSRKVGYARWRPAMAQRQPSRLLLTGATGFLGSAILEELLRNTHCIVYCLVRDLGAAVPVDSSASGDASDEPGAQEMAEAKAWNRVMSGLEKLGVLTEELRQEAKLRVVVVRGDLSKPLLGLEAEQFRELAGTVDAIVHNGAEVNLIKSFKDLKANNVLGTQEVLRLATQTGAFRTIVKPVHYVSTNSVFPSSAPRPYREDDDLLAYAESLTEGYSQSKWVSDVMVRRARDDRGLPVSVWRPGNMGAHSRTGKWNESDFVFLLLAGCARLGCAPNDAPWRFDVTPVDFAARALVQLAVKTPVEGVGRVFHLQTPLPAVEAADMFRMMCECGIALEMVPLAQWKQRLVAAARDQADDVRLQRLAVGLEAFEEYYSLPSGLFACDNLVSSLERHGGAQCPAIDQEWVRLVVGSFR